MSTAESNRSSRRSRKRSATRRRSAMSFPGITHPLRPPRAVAAAAPAWPTFKGTATVVGTSSNGVTVYVDQALGSQGMQDAQSLLSSADSVVAQNDAIFGITGGPVDVIVYAIGGATDGTGGADHGGCDFTTGNAIEVEDRKSVGEG